MVEQSPTSLSIPSARGPQFSLRWLMLFTGATALFFAMISYFGWTGVFLFLFLCLIGFSAAFYHRKDKRRAIVFFLGAWFSFLLFQSNAPLTHWRCAKCYICTHCGIMQWKHEVGPIGSEQRQSISEEYYSTDASEWYQEHFGECPEHFWSERRGWGTSFSSRFGLSIKEDIKPPDDIYPGVPSLLNDDDKRRLDELFIQDKAACKETFLKMLQ